VETTGHLSTAVSRPWCARADPTRQWSCLPNKIATRAGNQRSELASPPSRSGQGHAAGAIAVAGQAKPSSCHSMRLSEKTGPASVCDRHGGCCRHFAATQPESALTRLAGPGRSTGGSAFGFCHRRFGRQSGHCARPPSRPKSHRDVSGRQCLLLFEAKSPFSVWPGALVRAFTACGGAGQSPTISARIGARSSARPKVSLPPKTGCPSWPKR